MDVIICSTGPRRSDYTNISGNGPKIFQIFLLQRQAAITREVTRSRKHLPVRGGLRLGLREDILLYYSWFTLDAGRGGNKGRGRHKKFITTEEAY